MNEEIVKQVFSKAIEKVKNKICPFCNVKINESDFKDRLSLKEYKISGLCMKCQDEVFK